jgi:hypothetical protein
VTGEPRFEEGISTLRQFWESQPTKNSLWDFRAVTLGRLTYGELKEIIDYIRHRAHKRAGGKTVLVGSKDLVKGAKKIMETCGGPNGLSFQIKVFRSMKKANKWLDEEKA